MLMFGSDVPVWKKRAQERAAAFNARIDAERTVAALRVRMQLLSDRVDKTNKIIGSDIGRHSIERMNRFLAQKIAEKFAEKSSSHIIEAHMPEIEDVLCAALDLSVNKLPSDGKLTDIGAILSLHSDNLKYEFDKIVEAVKDVRRALRSCCYLSRYAMEIVRHMNTEMEPVRDYSRGLIPVEELDVKVSVYWDHPLSLHCAQNVRIP